MHDILIVTSRNVATTGGEFSLIKNRAIALEKHWDLSSDIISLCNTNLGVSEGEEAFGEGIYVRKNFFNPISLLTGYEQLIKEAEKALSSFRYKAVLLSGVGLLRYADRIRRSLPDNALLCADVHGYFGDGKMLAKEEPLALGAFHTLAAMVEEHEQKNCLRKFDRIFVVSAAYRDYLCEVANCRNEQFYIVPCGIGSIPAFSEDQILHYRTHYRTHYGIRDDETLLVYSGGASAWQCLPDTVDLYRDLASIRPSRMLILSGDKDGVRAKIGDAGDILIDSYKPADLPKVFCAADYFIMLREDVPTNHFAYPNKFLEYLASHKPVIATPFVYDVAKQIQESQVGIIFNGDIDMLDRAMSNFECEADAYDRVVHENSFQETLEPFVQDLNL